MRLSISNDYERPRIRGGGRRRASTLGTLRSRAWYRLCSHARFASLNLPSRKGIQMGFSGIRALIMILVLVALMIGMSKFNLPGWIIPVGLLATGAVLKAGAPKRTS